MIWTMTSGRASAAPATPGSRWRNGRIALKRCVTVRTPRSKAALACSAVASVWPTETAMPRASSRSISSPAPGQLGRERDEPDRPGGEQALEQRGVGVAPRARAGACRAASATRNGPSRWAPRMRGPPSVSRGTSRERGEQLLLGRGDEGREVGGDAGLEQRLAGAPVALGVGRRGSRRRRSRSPGGRRSPARRCRGRSGAGEPDRGDHARRRPRRRRGRAARRRAPLRPRASRRAPRARGRPRPRAGSRASPASTPASSETIATLALPSAAASAASTSASARARREQRRSAASAPGASRSCRVTSTIRSP